MAAVLLKGNETFGLTKLRSDAESSERNRKQPLSPGS